MTIWSPGWIISIVPFVGFNVVNSASVRPFFQCNVVGRVSSLNHVCVGVRWWGSDRSWNWKDECHALRDTYMKKMKRKTQTRRILSSYSGRWVSRLIVWLSRAHWQNPFVLNSGHILGAYLGRWVRRLIVWLSRIHCQNPFVLNSGHILGSYSGRWVGRLIVWLSRAHYYRCTALLHNLSLLHDRFRVLWF